MINGRKAKQLSKEGGVNGNARKIGKEASTIEKKIMIDRKDKRNEVKEKKVKKEENRKVK